VRRGAGLQVSEPEPASVVAARQLAEEAAVARRVRRRIRSRPIRPLPSSSTGPTTGA
jgi:hypothetical protein